MITCTKCGTQDFFFKEKKGNFCAYCGTKIVDVIIGFGKYKGRSVHSLSSIEEKRYLSWVLDNFVKLDRTLKRAIINQIK